MPKRRDIEKSQQQRAVQILSFVNGSDDRNHNDNVQSNEKMHHSKMTACWLLSVRKTSPAVVNLWRHSARRTAR